MTLPIEVLSDDELGKIIFPYKDCDDHGIVDFEKVHKELKRKHVTLMLLWEEELEVNPKLYTYNNFCLQYRKWKQGQKISMKQTHKAGEKCFIDYAGTTVPIFDNKAGKSTPAQIFVSVLGASDYTYAEASWGQSSKDFLRSNINACNYYGGVSEV